MGESILKQINNKGLKHSFPRRVIFIFYFHRKHRGSPPPSRIKIVNIPFIKPSSGGILSISSPKRQNGFLY